MGCSPATRIWRVRLMRRHEPRPSRPPRIILTTNCWVDVCSRVSRIPNRIFYARAYSTSARHGDFRAHGPAYNVCT